MIAFIARLASHGAAGLERALTWLSRAVAARTTMAQLARMSDAELRDIGLVQQDVVDIGALRLDADRSARRPAVPRRANLAA